MIFTALELVGALRQPNTLKSVLREVLSHAHDRSKLGRGHMGTLPTTASRSLASFIGEVGVLTATIDDAATAAKYAAVCQAGHPCRHIRQYLRQPLLRSVHSSTGVPLSTQETVLVFEASPQFAIRPEQFATRPEQLPHQRPPPARSPGGGGGEELGNRVGTRTATAATDSATKVRSEWEAPRGSPGMLLRLVRGLGYLNDTCWQLPSPTPLPCYAALCASERGNTYASRRAR